LIAAGQPATRAALGAVGNGCTELSPDTLSGRRAEEPVESLTRIGRSDRRQLNSIAGLNR
jgi:hypothetical protein